MNTKFQMTNIPSNKVGPTRYIEEHGGITAFQRPPVSHAGDVAGTEYQPVAINKTLDIPHIGAMHLPPIASPREVTVNNTADNIDVNAIATVTHEHRHTKKRKHKKHRHTKQESINPTVQIGIATHTEPMADIVDRDVANAEQDEERKQKRVKKRKHRHRISQMPHNDNLMNDDNEKLVDDNETTV